jgi:sugar-specific transcriptional regulator TrmB
MDFKEQLKKAGLTDNEAIVYQALLEMGPKNASIISRRTGLHRRVIYDVTDRLIKKGLIGYIIENNKRLFQASNPNRFLEILDEEKTNINNIMPNMLELFNQKKEERNDTMFFKGKTGLKSVFEDQLAEKKEILILGANNLAYEILDIYFHWFDKKRQENKIKTKIIFNEVPKKKINLAEVKYLPQKDSSPLAINIYGEKVAIIYWDKEHPFAVLIKQKEIAQGYKKYFEMIWKLAKK